MSHHDQLNFYLFYTFPVLLKVHTTWILLLNNFFKKSLKQNTYLEIRKY
jgi:hypothetical protein